MIWNREMETASRATLRALQGERLGRACAWAVERVPFYRGALEIWREVMARSLAAGGAEPGQLIQIAYGYGLFTGGLGFHDGAEHMGLTVMPVSSGNTLRQILLLQDFRPQGLACTPSFALHIGETMREQGIDPRSA